MPTRYLDEASDAAIGEVKAYMKKSVGVEIDLNTAIKFLFNKWKDSLVDGDSDED